MTRRKQIWLRPMRSWAMIGAWGYDAPGCDLRPLRLELGKQTGTRPERSTGGKALRFCALWGKKVLPERMSGQTLYNEARKKYFDTVPTCHATERTP